MYEPSIVFHELDSPYRLIFLYISASTFKVVVLLVPFSSLVVRVLQANSAMMCLEPMGLTTPLIY